MYHLDTNVFITWTQTHTQGIPNIIETKPKSKKFRLKGVRESKSMISAQAPLLRAMSRGVSPLLSRVVRACGFNQIEYTPTSARACVCVWAFAASQWCGSRPCLSLSLYFLLSKSLSQWAMSPYTMGQSRVLNQAWCSFTGIQDQPWKNPRTGEGGGQVGLGIC